MDFDREYELEDAGIDPFDFSLMDEDERKEALNDAGLDPDDFDDVEYDREFDAWSSLQAAGLSLSELRWMEDEERKSVLEETGLDPDEYESLSYYSYTPIGNNQPSVTQCIEPKNTIPAHVEPKGRYIEPNAKEENEEKKAELLAEIAKLKKNSEQMEPANYEAKAHDPIIIETNISECDENNTEKPLINEDKEKTVPQPETIPQMIRFPVVPNDPPKEVNQGGSSKRKGYQWFLFFSAAILVFFLVTDIYNERSTKYAASSTYKPSSTYRPTSTYRPVTTSKPSTPPCPPVNRELAMTKEEAKKLSGTGYHGTRPNSSAEDLELKAAQVRCKNCGYRSHNGYNSLCDYCSWMQRYGGGLPTQKAPDATPRPTARPTPKPTPRPTTKPKSQDPFHASNYSYPDDFYEDYYDDFFDYEDAEDYWEKHH